MWYSVLLELILTLTVTDNVLQSLSVTHPYLLSLLLSKCYSLLLELILTFVITGHKLQPFTGTHTYFTLDVAPMAMIHKLVFP